MTLIEAMMALVIMAILASIAYPAYRLHLQRGWLAEGTNLLTTYAQRMERAYDGNGNYGATACAVTAPAATSRWTITCALQSSGQSFLATATGSGTASGFTYTLSNAGAQRTTSYGGAAATANCWLIRGTEC